MITNQGFIRKTIDEVKADIKAKFQVAFTDLIDGVPFAPSLEPESFLGALSTILATKIDELNQQAEDVYYSIFAATAEGVQLDRVASPILRLNATSAEAEVELTGDPDTIVPAGTLFETEDKRKFALVESVVIGIGGTITGTVLSVLKGFNQNAPIDSITFIPVPVDGLDSVTNTTTATGGTDIEDDADFRGRVLSVRAIEQTSSLQSIIDAVRNVVDVTAVNGYENTGFDFDISGLPPGAVLIVVRGGLDLPIAQAIFEKKAAGIGTYGSTSVMITDSQGIVKTIKFSRVTDVQVFVKVTKTVNGDYNAGQSDPIIQQRILDYIGGVNPGSVVSEGANVGESIYAWKASGSLFELNDRNGIPGLINVVVKLGPSFIGAVNDSFAITADEKAITDFTQIQLI